MTIHPTYTEVVKTTKAESDGQPPFNLLTWVSQRGVIVFTILLILFAVLFIDGFASFANITDVFYRAAPIGIVALGMTFVVVSGNYLDLSVRNLGGDLHWRE
jgi:ribose/xylose/arabinose/galactoside ABC-type transport system permease subunit